VDGIIKNSTLATGNITQGSQPFCIGEEASSTDCNQGFNFNGTIDEVAIYNRSLSSDEIYNHYITAISCDNYGWESGNAIIGTGVNLFNTFINTFFTDLWEFYPDSLTPPVEFDNGYNQTANTFGWSGGLNNDGWDLEYGVYGGSGNGGYGDDIVMNGDGDIATSNDGDKDQSDNTVNDDDKLIISIGSRWDSGGDTIPQSGAYGIEFYINQVMYNSMESAIISFDWEGFSDTGSTWGDEAFWVKARFSNSSDTIYLGSNLDNNRDTTNDVFYVEDPDSSIFSDRFSQDVSSLISGPGWYYFDVGAKATENSGDSSWDENYEIHIDNIMFAIVNKTGNIYFRKKFEYDNSSNMSNLQVKIYSDDRADVYINGYLIDNDTIEHDGKYWSREIDLNFSYLINGTNQIAVRLKNNDTQAAFDLAIGENRRKSMLVMSDGAANRCHGPPDGEIDNNTWQGSCGTTKAINETISFACYAHENYDIEIYAVAFGNAGATAIDTLNKTACCDDCSHFYTSNNVSGLREIYKEITERLYQINVEKKGQVYNVTGNFSRNILYPDSYIELNYTPIVSQLAYGYIPFTIETAKFNNYITSGSFNVPQNIVVSDAKITSYSGYLWTKTLSINNPSLGNWITVYNLSDYGDDYQILGDPYIVQIPMNLIEIGNTNNLLIKTGINYTNISGGSPDDRAIYTIRIRPFVNYSGVFPVAIGCNWTIKFEDGTNSSILIPQSYNGLNKCDYENSIYNTNDAIDNAAFDLFKQLDLDNNGKLFVKIDSNNLEVDIKSLAGIPYMWGPSLIEMRVWE
jgi:hypothetical protein